MKANNILKLLPCLAAFLTIPANAGDDEKVTLNKTATYNYETQTGEITLETYLQGGVRTTATSSSTKPLDVIMVLDFSYSMTDSYKDNETTSYQKAVVTTYTASEATSNNYYASLDGTNYKIKVKSVSVDSKLGWGTNTSRYLDPFKWAYIEPVEGSGVVYYVTLDGCLHRSTDTTPGITPDTWPKDSSTGEVILPVSGSSKQLFGVVSFESMSLQNSTKTKRTDGLKASVATFIDLIEKSAKATGVTHRISMIDFQNHSFPTIAPFYLNEDRDLHFNKSAKQTLYVNSSKTEFANIGYLHQSFLVASGYTSENKGTTGVISAFRSITETNTVTSLQADLALVSPEGHTAIDYGMYLAKLQLENCRSEAERIIVVFTDGKPTGGDITADNRIPDYAGKSSISDADVSANAILYANQCKALGATVYAIGCFSGSDKPEDGFLDKISSNYDASGSAIPEAQRTFSKIINGNMVSTFESIANSSLAGATFTTETIIQDAMNMSYFKLPAGMTKNDVKLYKDTCIGYNATTKVYSFANNLKPISIPADSINVDVNTGIVKIKGFDFQANWCGLVNDDTHTHGNRLVAKFPFELKGGDNMPTNVLTNDGAKSGLIPKPESGAYPSAPTDAALKFPTPSLKFATIEIVRKGLDAGESAIYIVTCGTDTVACVSVNGVGADQSVSKFIYGLEAGAGKMYKVTETNWNWAYKKDPTSGYIEKEVNPSDNSAVQFVFGGTHIEKSSTDPTEKLHPAEIHNHDEQYIPNIINVESLK